MTAGRRRDDGYAVLAAMVAAAAAALVALQIGAASHDAVISASAEATRARLSAAAQAGVASALAGLAADDPAARWTLDGDPHTLDFGDAVLTLRIEDERGKIPLNTISREQARAMFTLAGADGAVADALASAFVRLRQGDSPGAARGLYDVGDLKRLPGMSDALYAVIAPSASVEVRDAAFEPRTSTPLALEVMTGAAPGSPSVIARERELAGETAALDTGPPLALAGRPLTLRVEARDDRGDAYVLAEVVELTRAAQRPVVVRRLAGGG